MRIRPLILICAALLPATAYAAPDKPCTAPERHQFDFWVGRWDVFRASNPDQKVAESQIENLYGGCAIRENWMPLRGKAGGSLNAYDPIKREWRQFWADGDGSSALFTGHWTGMTMVIEGVWPQPGHPHQITRITYTPRKDGSVEQMGQSSDDGGNRWTKSFDLIYRKPAK